MARAVVDRHRAAQQVKVAAAGRCRRPRATRSPGGIDSETHGIIRLRRNASGAHRRHRRNQQLDLQSLGFDHFELSWKFLLHWLGARVRQFTTRK
jgi:hypothetical protein